MGAGQLLEVAASGRQLDIRFVVASPPEYGGFEPSVP
jgi:hypothetical protein